MEPPMAMEPIPAVFIEPPMPIEPIPPVPIEEPMPMEPIPIAADGGCCMWHHAVAAAHSAHVLRGHGPAKAAVPVARG